MTCFLDLICLSKCYGVLWRPSVFQDFWPFFLKKNLLVPKTFCIFAPSKKIKVEKRIVFKFSVDIDLPLEKENLKRELMRAVSGYFGGDVDVKCPVVDVDILYGGFPDAQFENNTEISLFSQQQCI